MRDGRECWVYSEKRRQEKGNLKTNQPEQKHNLSFEAESLDIFLTCREFCHPVLINRDHLLVPIMGKAGRVNGERLKKMVGVFKCVETSTIFTIMARRNIFPEFSSLFCRIHVGASKVGARDFF